PLPEEPSFEPLMDRLRAGDQAAAAAVFHRFARRLIGLARQHLDARLRRKVDPEDVLQSALRSFFVRHAEGRFDLAGWEGLWSLLALITLRKCGHQVEHYRAACRDLGREQEASPTEDAMASWTALAAGPSPPEAAVLAETVEQLLAGLREQDRRI